MARRPRWESPPPNGSHDWTAIADQLRARPNQWLMLGEDSPIGVVNALRQDSIRAIHPIKRRKDTHEGFEVMTRNNKTGPPKTADLYLRYFVPEE